MGPRKRLRSAAKCNAVDENPSEDLTESSETRRVSPKPKDPPTYFSLLPNEVMLCIYKYLSPVDLLSMSELDKRFRQLTYTIKEANFSSCRTASAMQISSYFSRNRVKCIQKLNFNYETFLRPHMLVSLINRCKNLKSLSIVDCGINCKQLFEILLHCLELEELAWNIRDISMTQPFICFPELKTVYLFCDVRLVPLKSVNFAIKNFSEVQTIFINFSSDSLIALPFLGNWLRSSFVSSANCARNRVLISNSFQCISSGGVLHYPYPISNLDLFAYKVCGQPISGKDDSMRSRVYKCPPYLQIRSTEEDISSLSSGPYKAFSSLTVILTPEIVDLCESLIKCVQEVSGHKLKQLSLQSEAYEVIENGKCPKPISNEEAYAVSDMLEKMFLSCKNITVLNLSTVHFGIGSPFKAICQLQKLRTLSIPSCAFKSFIKPFGRSKLHNDEDFEFQKVVSSCPFVDHFQLICCRDDIKRVTEEAMIPIKDWKSLKHLCLYSLIFRNLSFLKKVAESCIQLSSLSIITVAEKHACLFMNDIINVLKIAKNLSFLRINEPKFNPMFERFWNTIGEAVNLEGICIITESEVYVDRRTVVNAIKKLKYLHLFHFYSPRSSHRIITEAKKSMEQYGIFNGKLDNRLNINSDHSSEPQYYHQQPHFCCQHLHLTEINLF